MGKGSKSGGSHRLFKDRAKNRVDDLQGIFTDLQSARKESRSGDVSVLEEQVHQMLREWKAELSEPSPASSGQGGSLGLFSDFSEIYRQLPLAEEQDDATSALAAPKPEPDAQKVGDSAVFQEVFNVAQGPQEHDFQLADQCKGSPSGVNFMGFNNMGLASQLDYHSFDLPEEFDPEFFAGIDGLGLCGEDTFHPNPGFLQNICPPPSAYLGPICALWDCLRPALGWSQDYCNSVHAALAPAEGQPGRIPVLRPGGINLKDSSLFSALSAKAQGKEVGVPECEGAATTKSPWNAQELFDLNLFEGETIREWLFFDKPRRAFESGNRKQRSLPDYSGRGWHESRKQVMNEFGGLKRSYYMDPQPIKNYEWHLYEYEINKYDVCALYRLELKLVSGKKSPKGKVGNDSVADLQKQMGRLTAEFPSDNKRSFKVRANANSKDGSANFSSSLNRVVPTNDGLDFGTSAAYDYLVDTPSGYY
ncbi:hypothetical protein RJ640_030019 [Escallonia rubra]|uniref:Transcription factor VOZ1 n=1 Tax=Escallonia rubra TaxID=112253 RepID=A0AA88UNP6_9ASTE|nr:hypothetical protein RJ640_030019 [Escallonia rubra]